ncbi:unnamed protein product [Cyclocybe aegerita]|uniref:Carbohydrate esterase family 16 protein n=1 Tax=Cyclocybe aegerita TaxID=1973307 RepID=A0A8S0Y0W2_CYCAE|nr:unnamed protein product [Cyclocybe aegerita]
MNTPLLVLSAVLLNCVSGGLPRVDAQIVPEVPAGNTNLTPTKFNWDRIKYVHAFGDSYSFVQGTRGRANYSFIGDALDFAFTPEELLTNEIIPRYTSSDGSNWLEFLTGCFSGRPARCRRQLWDFAFAGADIDANLLPLHHDYTVPLVDQLKQWSTYAADSIPHSPGQTLAAWWIGINDTGDAVNNATIVDSNAFWEQEVASYFRAVQVATDRGLHTHLFVNVPPGERAPSTVNNSTKAAILKAHIAQFNSVLSSHIISFKKSNPRTEVITFDANTWFNAVLDDPLSYGFTNTTGFCKCADPAGFFWYDSGHPTERVHRLLAEAIEAKLHAHKTA